MTARPQTGQLASWAEGTGILILCGTLLLWFLSLALRYTDGQELVASMVWLSCAVGWLLVQIAVARQFLPERAANSFSTLLQALIPTLATITFAVSSPVFRGAVIEIASSVTTLELVAIHALRLAAWGTVRKYQEGSLPRYFFLFGSIPDFGFAVLSVLLTLGLAFGLVAANAAFFLWWSGLGAAVFLGAAISMYFGVPGSPLSWRWERVKSGVEPPTLLPFRWPMNLAPAFCGPAFWLAHALLVVKVVL